MSSSAQGHGPRRRRPGPSPPVTPVPSGTRQINAAPLLETAKPGIDPDAPLTLSRVIAVTVAIAHATVPTLVSWGLTMALIFGGCCSNVGLLRRLQNYTI